MAAPRTATETPLTDCIVMINVRLLTRSTIAPPGNENRSHGAKVATVTPLTTTGSLVIAAMRSGNAVSLIPSPILETAADTQSRQKSRESSPARVVLIDPGYTLGRETMPLSLRAKKKPEATRS